jgi:hypothetical protein
MLGKEPHGIALSVETSEALSPTVRYLEPVIKLESNQILRRNQALHLLLPRPLCYPAIQDPISSPAIAGVGLEYGMLGPSIMSLTLTLLDVIDERYRCTKRGALDT